MEDQSSTFTPSAPDKDTLSKKSTIQYSAASQFGILVAMAFIGMIVGNLLALVPLLLKGVNLINLESALNNPANAGMLRWMQIIGTFFTFLFPVWLFNRIVHPPKDFIQIRTKSGIRIWVLVAVLAIASLPVTDLFGSINRWIPLPAHLARTFQRMEDSYSDQVMFLMQMKGLPDFIASLFIVALLPAIFEESFFRGAFQQVLIRWLKHPYWAIVITAIVFSVIHISYYGFLPRAFLGVLLGCIYYWTKDLKLNILIHFINNAISVISFYILSKRHELTPEKMNESLPWYSQLGGLILFVCILSVLYKFLQKHNIPTTQI